MADTPQQPQTVRIYDASGAPVDTTPDYAVELLRSKRGYGMAEGDTIPLRVPGERDVRMVEANEAVRGIMAREYDAAPVEVFQKQQREREFTGVAPAIAGLATGAVKGLISGAGDAALIGAAGLVGQREATRRYLQGLEEFQPMARATGEALGFAAPLAASLFTGGGTGAAALAARGATAVPRALTAAGAATEAAAARGLVGLGLAEGGAVARGLSMAAGQAVEMGAYGAGEALSRVAVQRPELTGEQAVAAMGQGFLHGALAGGIGGAALGAAVPMVRGIVSKGLETATSAAERVTGRTSTMADGSIGQQLSKLVDTAAPGGVEKWAEDKAIKSLGGNQAQIDKALSGSAALRAEVATTAVERLPQMLGKQPGVILSHTEQNVAAPMLLNAVGKEKKAIVEELVAAGVKADVPAIAKVAREKISKYANSPVRVDIAAHREGSKMLDRIEKAVVDGDVAKLWEQQKRIGNSLDKNGGWKRIRKGEGTLSDNITADIYWAIGGEFERIGEQATGLGKQFVDRWKNINLRYQAADIAAKNAEKGRLRDVTNATLGLREMIGGSSGKAAGAAVGAATGAMALGPAGALVGGALGSVAGGAVSAMSHHLIRKYGDQAAASVLRTVAKNGGDVFQAAAVIAERTMGQAVTSYVKAAAKGALPVAARAASGVELAATKAMLATEERKAEKPLPRAAQRTAGVPLLQASPTARVEPRTGPKGAPQGPVEQRYRAAKEAVKEFASPASQARVRMAAGLVAPGDIARATAQTAVRGSNYLMSKLPPDTMGIKTLQPKFDDITPSEQEMAAFLRAATVVDNPMSVFESLRRGDLTTDEVDALRNVYPEMYTQLQSLVLSEVATLDRPLPYDKALALGHLIGVPAHPTMTPEFIATQQQALTAEAAKPQPRPAQRPANLARGYDLNREES